MEPTAWPRVDAWLVKHAPNVLALLRAPISAAGLAKVEEAAGRPLPPSLLEAYRAHDGTVGEHPTILGAVRLPKAAQSVRHMSWLPADRAVGSLRFMRELVESWPPAFLPIADDQAGNLIVCDLDTDALAVWDHEDRTSTPLAGDLASWIARLADDMDAGLVVAGAAEDGADDALELLDAPAGPAAPAPVILPDRAARVFVEVLVEKRYAVLAKGVDVEPLVAALTTALSVKGAAARRRGVIDLLEASEAIEEIFVDDDKLEGLVDEIR
jgi:cell wall assembly regulator SMI1